MTLFIYTDPLTYLSEISSTESFSGFGNEGEVNILLMEEREREERERGRGEGGRRGR